MLRADDIAAGPVYNLDQAPQDPQIQYNNMILTLNHSLGGQVKLVGNPIKMPTIHTEEYTAPPTLGQHTHQVLSGLLGYSRRKSRSWRRSRKNILPRCAHMSPRNNELAGGKRQRKKKIYYW